MSVTTDRSELDGHPVTELAERPPDTASQFIAGNSRSYADDRRARIQRRRLAGFAASISVWALCIVPLTREILDGRDSSSLAVYLAVAAGSLAVVAVIRAVYSLLTKRRFWSPWLFVIAAVLALAGYAVQSAGEEVPALGALTAESRPST